MALSPVLPFDQWVESEQASGLEGLDKIRAYGDHYRSTTFASGNYNPREAAEVDNELFSLARNSGLVDQDDLDLAEQQFYGGGETPLTDEDLSKVIAYRSENNLPGQAEVRDFLAMRNVEDATEELIASKATDAEPFLTAQDLRDADRASALRGDQPFSVQRGEDGNLVIEFDPNLSEETLTNERIAQIAKQQGIDTRFLPSIRAALDKPAGLTVSRARAQRNAELRGLFSKTEDETISHFKDVVTDLVKKGQVEAARTEAARLVRHNSALARNYSATDVANALVDYALYGNDSDQAQFLSTGEVVMPSNLHTRPEEFDAAVDALSISDEQKALTKAGRNLKMEALAPQFHKIASAVGGSEYTAHYEAGKAAGKSDGTIVEEWFADEENYNSAANFWEGTFVGALEGFAGLVLYPMALAGNEDARKTVGGFMRDNSFRKSYAGLFGEELGLGYDITRTAPSVVADIALSIPTGGAVGLATSGARWTVRQGAKSVFGHALGQAAKDATAIALRRGTAGSVATALKTTGDDFVKKLGSFAYQSAAVSPSAFSRSAGATYTQVYSALENQHPDWSAQQIREAAYGHAVWSGAITVGIMSAFNGLAQAFPKYFGSGVEEWAKGSGGGLTMRQMRSAYEKIARAPGRIPQEIRNYINIESFESFVASTAKQGMKNSVLGHLFKHSSSEAVEEGLDEFINGWRASAFLDEDKNILDHLRAAGHAAVIGGVFGAGGGVREAGIRSSLSDTQTQSFEQNAFENVALQLERGGDTESATVLRSLIARSQTFNRTVTNQLEAFGRFAARQQRQAEAPADPIEKILKADPSVPSNLQRYLTKSEEFLSQFDDVDPTTLSDKQRVKLAAARIYQRRLTDISNRAIRSAAEGVERGSRQAGPVLKGDVVVANDTGTSHKSFADKYKVSNAEEAETTVASLNEEISRLGSRGDQATPYQVERAKYLSEQRDAIRAQYPRPDTSPQTADPVGPSLGPVSSTKPSKLVSQLRDVESGLASLRRLERTNPAVANIASHRARKVSLRSRRRSLREAIANESTSASKPISWRQYPVAQIAANFVPLQEGENPLLASAVRSDAPVFDAQGNQVIDPNIDPEEAMNILTRASEEKRAMDAKTISKMERGQSVTAPELESLATEDPDVQYAEVVEGLRPLVAALNPESFDHLNTPNPDKALQVQALLQARIFEERRAAIANAEAIPADVIEDEVEAFAAEVEQETPEPEGRSIVYQVEGSDQVVIAKADEVTVTKGGEVTATLPATTIEEADAAARSIVETSGAAPEAIQRTEQETDPVTEAAAAVAGGDVSPIEEAVEETIAPLTDVQEELVSEAEQQYLAASLESLNSGKTTAEVLATKENEARQEISVLDDIVPILSSQPPKGYTTIYSGGPVAVEGFNPDLHVLATPKGKHKKHFKKGEITVINRKSGRPLKRKSVRLSGEGVTLYGSDGAPQFLSAADETLFWELVESGAAPETRAFLDSTDLKHSLTSHSPYYLQPFLRTVRAEIEANWPTIAPPSTVKRSSSPNVSEQIVYSNVFYFRGGNGQPLSRRDVVARASELMELLGDTRASRESTVLKKANEDVDRALAALAEAEGLVDSHAEQIASYNELLRARDEAEARVELAIEELRKEEIETKKIVSDSTTPESQRALAEEYIASKHEGVTRAQGEVAQINHEVGLVPDPETIPDLSNLEREVARAQAKLTTVKKAVRKGSYSNASLEQQIDDLLDLAETGPADKSVTFEFTEKETTLSSRRERRLREAKRNNKRGIRSSIKSSKLTRNGETLNSSIPLEVKTTTNEDGLVETKEKVFFTNNPLEMAEAVNLGYRVVVPKDKRDSVNPAIRIDESGVVTEVFHPIKQKTVSFAGDLLEWGAYSTYTPSAIQDTTLTGYIDALPPVLSEDVPRLGSTALGTESDNIEPNSRDGGDATHFDHAYRFFWGIQGGQEKSATKDAKDRIRGEYQGRLEQIRDSLREFRQYANNPREATAPINPLTNQRAVDTEIEDTIIALENELEVTIAQAQEKYATIDENEEKLFQSENGGRFLHNSVKALESVVNDVGGEMGEAFSAAELLYRQDIREFGLAARLIRLNNEGKDPVKWFTKILDSADAESRAAFVRYIRARHKSKAAKTLTTEQAVAFLTENVEGNSDEVAGKIRAWAGKKKKPNQLSVRQLSSFIASEIKQPELATKLREIVESESKDTVGDPVLFRNYVNSLVNDFDPPANSTSRWVQSPGHPARPSTFLRVVDTITRRYRDARANKTVPRIDSIDYVGPDPDRPDAAVALDKELVAALEGAWADDTATTPDVDLTDTQFYVTMLSAIRKSDSASAALRSLARELGTVANPDSDPLETVLMATHGALFKNSAILDELSPELRSVVRALYKSGARSRGIHDVRDAEDTLTVNNELLSSRARKAGFPPVKNSKVQSLNPDRTRQFAYWYLNSNESPLTPEQKSVLKPIAKVLDSDFSSGWPATVFLANPSGAYSTFTGAYSPEGSVNFVNLTKADALGGDALLRGLVRHVLNSVEPTTPGYDVLVKLGEQVMDLSPGTKHMVYKDQTADIPRPIEAVRYAMNDPEVFADLTRKRPSAFRRLVKGVADILGVSSATIKNRLGPILKPDIGRVWGGEPKVGRSINLTQRPESLSQTLQRLAPSGVRVVESDLHTQPAWVTTAAPDKVHINPASIDPYVRDLESGPREQILRAILNHELAHLASLQTLTNKDRAEIHAEMSDADFRAVRARVPAGSGHLELAEEFIRMKVEQAAYGVDSDTFVQSVLAYGTGLRAKLVRAIGRFVNALKGMMRARPSIRTAVHIDRVQTALASIERGGLELRPVPTTDIEGHMLALEELENGTERTFFAAPIQSTDESVMDRYRAWRRRSKLKKEAAQIDTQQKFKRNGAQAMIKDLHIKIRKAAQRGTVIVTSEINDALGSTDAYLTDAQKDMLRAAREADVAAGLDPETVKSNSNARIRVAHAGNIQQKEAAQATALDAIKRKDPVLAKEIQNFRDALAELSRDVGAIRDGGSLKAVFDDRANVHLIRSYEFFHSRAYADAARFSQDDKGVPGYEDVPFNSLRSKAIDDIKAQYFQLYGKTLSGKEAWTKLNGLLASWSKLPPDQLTINTLTKSSDLFESKQNLPEGIRALLGQRSTIDSAAHTALQLSNYLAKHESAKSTRALLVNAGWAFDDPDAVPGEYLEPLWSSLQDDSDYEALHGLYAKRGDRELIESTFLTTLPSSGPEADALSKSVGRFTRKVFGTSLTLKTLFSLGFFTRNEGAMSFVMLPMQGHWGAALGFGGSSKRARRAGGIAAGGIGLSRFAEGEEEYTLELLRNGIIHDDVTVGLLRDLHGSTLNLGTDIQKDIDDFADGGKPKGWIKKAIDRVGAAEGFGPTVIEALKSGKGAASNLSSVLAKINELIDAKGKILLYELEVETLEKVRSETGENWTDEEIQSMAADKVHRTLPGHSQVYEPVRQFSRSSFGMLLAPFARFKGETVRIATNTIPLAIEEWKMGVKLNSPTLKKRALRRAASFGAIAAGWGSAFTWIISSIFDGLLGDDDDDDKKENSPGFQELEGEVGKTLRMGLPKWAQSHSIFARNNGDTITTYDLTYYNPLSLIQDPIKVLWDRTATDGVDAGVSGFVKTMAADFVGEGIGPGAIRQILENEDDYGSEIYLPTDSAGTAAAKMIEHYFDNALKPGIISKGVQVGKSITLKDQAVEGDRVYNAIPILIGEFTGVRPFEYKTDQLMKRSARNTKLQLDQIQRHLSPLNSPSFRSEEEIQDAVREYNEAYVQLWKQHRRNAAAWAQFTGNSDAVKDYARLAVQAGHSKDRTRKVIFGGVLDRFVRSRAGLENIYRAGETPGAEGGEKRVDTAVSAMLEQPRFIPLTD